MSHQVLIGVAAATRTVQGWEFRPSPFMARLYLAFGVWAVAFWVAAGLALWAVEGVNALAFFGLPIALFSLQLIVRVVWGWRLRATPLVVEPGGRVRYGDQELCPPGSVEVVRVVPDPHSEGDGHKVRLVLATGAVELPAPYFESFLTREQALRFAEMMAHSLNVRVVEPR
jgi:hypothetical protein